MSATDVICSAFLRKTLETSLPTLHLHPLGPVVTTHAPPLPVSYVTHSSQLRLTGACPHHLTAPRTQDNDSRHNGCSPKWMDKEERWWPRAILTDSRRRWGSVSPACCLSLSGDTRVSRLSSVSAASSLLSVCHVAALPPSFIAAFSFFPSTCSTRASNSCVVQHVHSFNVTVQMAPPPSTNKNHASFLDAAPALPPERRHLYAATSSE